MILTSIAHI